MSLVKEKQNYIACCIGWVVMVALSAAMVLLLSIFILNEYFPAEYTEVLIIILIGFITLVGTVITGYLTDSRAGWITLVTVGAYYTLLVFVSVSFFEGLTLNMLYSVIAGVVGYFVAWLLLRKGDKSRPRRKKRRGNR